MEVTKQFALVLQTQRRWGYLYRSYAPARAQWEVLVIIRKIVIAFAAVMASHASRQARPRFAALASIVLLCAILMNLWFKPYTYVQVLELW